MINVRKYMGVIIFFMMSLALLLSGCSKEAKEENKTNLNNYKAKENQIELKETKTKENSITVALYPDYPPFTFDDNGKPVGIYIDLLKEASKRNKIEVNFEIGPFNRSLERVKNGDVDAMLSIYKTPEREKFLDYVAESAIPDSNSFFVLTDSKIVYNGDLNKMKKYTIGVVVNNSYGSKFDNAVKTGLIKTEEATNVDAIITKLLGDRQKIIIGGTFPVLYTAKKLGVTKKLKELKPLVSKEFLMMGFSKKSSKNNLKDKFNITFKEMKRDGTYNKLINGYK